jgi:outer membrane lipoprotein
VRPREGLQSPFKGDISMVMRRLWWLAVGLLILSSCTYAISRNVRDQAVRGVSFTEVRDNIGKYRGLIFIWGGFIVSNTAEDGRTVLEVVQNPLDSYGEVVNADVSEGRFLAETSKTLDPSIYSRDRVVTVAGRLAGGRKKPLDSREYLYPVLDIIEIRLWPETKSYYSRPYYERYPYYGYPYPPYYDPFIYDPYYYDPFWRGRYPYRYFR